VSCVGPPFRLTKTANAARQRAIKAIAKTILLEMVTFLALFRKHF
jgi:hypothetical protein